MNRTSILITGSSGFIGKNLVSRLVELGSFSIETFTRENSGQDLLNLVNKADFIVHLAGENRPIDEKDFETVNTGLTSLICEAVHSTGRKIPIILTSSEQATLENSYGRSKLSAEMLVKEFESDSGNPVYIYRLPGVFGKWCKPNYNSVVATFCYNISRDLPIQVNDPSSELSLVYIDDVVEEFVKIIQGTKDDKKELSVQPEYKIKLGYLADQMKVYEPQYKRTEKKLSFRSDSKKNVKNFELNEKDLDKVSEMEGVRNFEDEVEEGFGTESEVVLTSWDSLPKDFDIANLEHSKYEEFRKNNNRDTRFGNKKVFRVMMKSVDPDASSMRLNKLLKKYNVTRVDNVKPGQNVPGGIYYNIFVPRDYLKEFLAQVMDLDEAILYETRTRGKNPPGKNKVFIWIKNL